MSAAIERLLLYFGAKTLNHISEKECRGYVKQRGNTGGSRRDLEVLRAAIKYHAKLGLHTRPIFIWLPDKGPPRDRWLTRDEAAKLLWACWRCREMQKGTPTGRKPLQHIARFILLGIYTGTRAGAIATASFHAGSGRSYIDLDQGIFYRLAQGKQATNKRQPPVPIPTHLLSHIRRWKEKGISISYVVEWHGKPVQSVKTGFKRAVKLARLEGDVTPHTLRHTAVTWLMQRGVSSWETGGYVGMSAQLVESVYGHHHPDYMRQAMRAITQKPPQKYPNKTTGTNGGNR